MHTLEWKSDLQLGLAPMDATHEEFVVLYNALAQAAPDDLAARFDAFVAHTEAHFEQENRWMEAVGFPGCHRAEHDRVLAVVRDVRKRLDQGDLFLARRLIEELPAWFDNHVSGMDAALAFHLDSIGFDVASGTLRAEGASCAGSAAAGACACTGAAAREEA